MLAQIMPRTGGDYVFNSRSLHPSIGFAGNFSYCVWLAVIYGVYTTYLATYGFGAFGRMMAGFTGSPAWLDFGDWFSKDYALFITGTVMLLLSAAVFIVGGLRLFLRLQVGAFVLYAAGAFLLPVLVGLFQSRAGFLANFNDYAANLGTPNATAALAASAKKAGFAPTGFDTETTLKSVTVFWYIFGFLYSSNYFAGEIRLRKRTHLVSIPGALRVGRRHRAAHARLPPRHGLQLQRPARLRRPRRVRLRGRRAGLPGDHGHRLRHLGARRDHHRRLRGRPADLAAADDAAGQPQHVRVVVRPDHARAAVLRRPAHALPGRSRSRS